MSDVAIRVEGLGKRYRIAHSAGAARYRTLREDLLRLPRQAWAALRGNGQRHETFWALKDVSFEVKQGEVLGIIGRNGAGKSTLLKILARITEPTTGQAEVYGRVGSLLEVGTGFHPELTGRENIYLSGAVLGMTRREVQRKFDEIVAFAEVEQFLDTPAKHYSSGMYMRLAFAVAAHLEPEILLVDEVLAVGDAEFQKKCLGKMGEVARAGRTVLFVSHNMAAVQRLTTQCLYLQHGQSECLGETTGVIQRYQAATAGQITTRPATLDTYHRHSVANAPARFVRLRLTSNGKDTDQISIGDDFTILAELEVCAAIRGAHWGIALKRDNGTPVTTLISIDHGLRLTLAPGRHVVSCSIQGLPLAPGNYVVDVGINQSPTTMAWDVIVDYPLFRAIDGAGAIAHWTDRSWGAVHWRQVAWEVVR